MLKIFTVIICVAFATDACLAVVQVTLTAPGATTGHVNIGGTNYPVTYRPNLGWQHNSGTNIGGVNVGGRIASQAPASGIPPATGTSSLIRPGLSTAAKVGAGVAAVAGAATVAHSVSGSGPHSWGNVIEGAVGGAGMGFAAGTVFTFVAGPVWGAAGGAVVGGVVAGSQIFSETDCLHDPAMINSETQQGVFTCCHTQYNKGERFVDIGGEMFCEFPGVRRCLQGGSDTKTSWWSGGAFKDDAWELQCTPKFCNGYAQPAAGAEHVVSIGNIEESGKVCWAWDCEPGYIRSGDKCVSDGSIPDDRNGVHDIYDDLIQRIDAIRKKIIDECGGI